MNFNSGKGDGEEIVMSGDGGGSNRCGLVFVVVVVGVVILFFPLPIPLLLTSSDDESPRRISSSVSSRVITDVVNSFDCPPTILLPPPTPPPLPIPPPTPCRFKNPRKLVVLTGEPGVGGWELNLGWFEPNSCLITGYCPCCCCC